MATEQEELRLTVSLVDNASAGLAALRQQITGLTSGQAGQSMEKFRRQQKDMGDQIKELTKVAFEGERAMLGYIGKFGALGLAAAGTVGIIKDVAKNLTDISRLGAALGVPATHIKNIVEQFKQVGVEQAAATKEVEGLIQALVDMGRIGSPQYQALLQHAGAYSQQMANTIAQMEQTNDVEDKMNIARTTAANIQKNRYDQDIALHKSVSEAQADSTQAAREFLGVLGLHLDVQQRIEGQIKKMTPEEEARQQQLLDQAKAVTRQWEELGASADHAGQAMLSAFGPVLSLALEGIGKGLDGILASMKAVNEFKIPPVEAYKPRLEEQQRIRALPEGEEKARAQEAAHEALRARHAVAPEPKSLGDTSLGRFFGFGGTPAAPLVPPPPSLVPKMQHGGIVRRPTLAMIGEAGPEAIVPLGGGLGSHATEDNTRETTDNTKQLAKLNDQLFEMLHPTGAIGGGGVGGISMQGLGGLPGFVGGGRGAGGGGTEGGAPGGAVGGGSAPYGSDAGPGTGAGAGGGGAPGVGGGLAPHGSDVGPGTGPGAGGGAVPVRRGGGETPSGGEEGPVDRSMFASVRDDPAFIKRMASMVQGEVGLKSNVNTQRAIAEEAFNRWQTRDQRAGADLYHGRGGYYASATFQPVSEAQVAKFKQDVLEPVLQGSNVIKGMTGNASNEPGNMVALHQFQRGTPGFWMDLKTGQPIDLPASYMGGKAEAMFREGPFKRQLAMKHDGVGEARRAVDRASMQKVQVEGNGKLTANINAPPGTDVSAEGSGVFKKIEVNRQVQMSRARRGPSPQAGGED